MNRIVAPHAGAWIETPNQLSSIHSYLSPPMRGRGLKPFNIISVILCN